MRMHYYRPPDDLNVFFSDREIELTIDLGEYLSRASHLEIENGSICVSVSSTKALNWSPCAKFL